MMTSKELAKILNTSPATISMVLNNRPGISETTRRLVLESAKKYGMIGHENNIRIKKPQYINYIIYKKTGYIVGDTPFFSQLIEGIQTQTKTKGYNLQVTYFFEEMDHSQQLNEIKASNSAGIILLGTEINENRIDLFTNLNIPMVVLDTNFQEKKLDYVVINNVQGAMDATLELLKLGHKDIGYLASTVRIVNFTEREEGFRKALNKKNDEFVFSVRPTTSGAYEDMDNILNSSPKLPTAFFADNDIIASSCIKAFKAHGLSIPEDISVIGFDDMLPLCQLIDPPLTTMQVPKQRMGIIAVNRLNELICEENDETIKIALYTSLISRASAVKIQ